MTVQHPLPPHTPYDGSSKAFAIGLRPLELDRWLEVDGYFGAQLAEKHRLYAELPDKVFVEEADTRDAQGEVLELIETSMGQYHEQALTKARTLGTIGPGALADAPLVTASLMAQDDLILMRRGDDGWRLAAGSLCFPSSWSLTEKFGKPLDRIHDPVPGFGTGTRPADIISRMFDNLQGQAVERFNWSVQANGALYHPLSDRQRIARSAERQSTFPDGDINAHAFIRVERQTLRKLPLSRDILFTIRIYLDPLAVLVRHPDRGRIAAGFTRQLGELEEAQLDYKGLTADRDRLVTYLDGMADG
ncbi:MAG TPA: DUF3445 domain-containing protein [Mesorhizobium sp.]|jgi:hypothetical protein|uniref:heme-dependent oxidative N-demethylase family protein n=1 Tax=Mesorhizobium sp. TaxID=1871066 RepID=UPI002DDD8069|nr:DUF3445 domain-containing protein [Mesorhizobium sp.]HEV2501990.1 DUF3445 domain-containing protein [Mesorhizobium sp.]